MITRIHRALSFALLALLVVLSSGKLRAEPVDWRMLEHLTAANFDKRWEELRQSWFRLEFVRAYDLKSEPLLAGIWLRNSDGRRWASKYGMSARSLTQELTRLHDDGYRVVDLAAFDDGGEASFLAAWVENKEGLTWATSHALPAAKFEEERKARGDAGLRPTVLQGYEIERQVYFNVLWLENKPELKWSLARDLSAAQLASRIKEERAGGLRPISYTSYTLGRLGLYGLVCVENKEQLEWQLLSDQTEAQFQESLGKLKEKYRPLALDIYDSGKGPRYGSIWVENK